MDPRFLLWDLPRTGELLDIEGAVAGRVEPLEVGDEFLAASLELRNPSLGGSDLMRDAIRGAIRRNQAQSGAIRGALADRT